MNNNPNGKFSKLKAQQFVGDVGKYGNVIIVTAGVERLRVEPNGNIFVEGRKADTRRSLRRAIRCHGSPSPRLLDQGVHFWITRPF